MKKLTKRDMLQIKDVAAALLASDQVMGIAGHMLATVARMELDPAAIENRNVFSHIQRAANMAAVICGCEDETNHLNDSLLTAAVSRLMVHIMDTTPDWKTASQGIESSVTPFPTPAPPSCN